MIIGVSGKSGSGKSSVCEYLENAYGYTWIDCDKIVKNMRDTNTEEILEIVKEDVLTDGKIDSKKLGEILFANKELLQKYNDYIYSKLKVVLNELIKEKDNVVLDSLFLPIMDIFKECDYKLLVVASDEVRKKRVLKRENISEAYFFKRDQYSLEYDANDFDSIVDNNSAFEKQVDQIIRNIN